jgi:hypothetical protein
VKWSVYLAYTKAIGGFVTLLIFSVFTLYQVGGIINNIWLSEWTDDPYLKNTSLANTTEYQDTNNMYLGVYAAIGVAQGMWEGGEREGRVDNLQYAPRGVCRDLCCCIVARKCW